MGITNKIRIRVSPLRLHSTTSIQIPRSTHNFRTMLPSVRIRPLNLFFASSINLQGAANTNVFRNNLRVRLSPLKSPILHKYTNPFKRRGMYPSISKCNAKRCRSCKHIRFGTKLYGQIVGIPMGTNCAPLVAALFL